APPRGVAPSRGAKGFSRRRCPSSWAEAAGAAERAVRLPEEVVEADAVPTPWALRAPAPRSRRQAGGSGDAAEARGPRTGAGRGGGAGGARTSAREPRGARRGSAEAALRAAGAVATGAPRRERPARSLRWSPRRPPPAPRSRRGSPWTPPLRARPVR